MLHENVKANPSLWKRLAYSLLYGSMKVHHHFRKYLSAYSLGALPTNYCVKPVHKLPPLEKYMVKLIICLFKWRLSSVQIMDSTEPSLSNLLSRHHKSLSKNRTLLISACKMSRYN